MFYSNPIFMNIVVCYTCEGYSASRLCSTAIYVSHSGLIDARPHRNSGIGIFSMSRYDDDYDDKEDELDDDDLEGEEGVRRSTANPFSSGANRPSSVRGAGLPQPQQRPPNNPDGSTPSPIRSGGTGGGNA